MTHSSAPAALLQMDAATVRRWVAAAVDALGAHRDEIDELNVFPVPDGDTGTNMLLTLRATAEALRRERPADLPAAAAVMARGALLGARGNSGVILSQVVRGMTEVLASMDDGPATSARMPSLLAAALRRGADLARRSVADPVEGTILTVADAAAEAALRAASTASADMTGVAAVATAASEAAAHAVALTPDQLPALARAGVVDAGGRGLSVILDALASVTGGSPSGGASWARSITSAAAARDLLEEEGADAHERGSTQYAYEVVYLLDTQEEATVVLGLRLRDLGDSLVMVSAGSAATALDDRGTTTWKVHVHVNDVGAAIEAGVEAGRPHQIEVTRFEEQIGNRIHASLEGVGVVAIAPGDTLATAFENEGVVVVDSGPARRPSTADVLKAIIATKAARVVILPNDRDCTAVADAAAAEARTEGYDVAVVSTKSVVQGMAAVAVHDPERRFADDVIAMAEAAAATRCATVTVAAREALTMAGPCRPGDVLGMVESEVVVVGSAVLEVALELLDRLLATGGELVTVVVGVTAPGGVVDDLRADLHTRHPEVEMSDFGGGHPDHPLLLGVE